MAQKISALVSDAQGLPVSVKANLHSKLSAQRGRSQNRQLMKGYAV